MPVPVLESTTTLGSATVNTAIITLPASLAANDVVVFTLYKENTEAVSPPDGTWFEIAPAATTISQGHSFFWKRCTGGESGTVTFTWTTAAFRRATAHRISGCRTVGNPYESSTNNQTNSSVTTLNVSLT